MRAKLDRLLDKAKAGKLSAAEKIELKELHDFKMRRFAITPKYRYEWTERE